MKRNKVVVIGGGAAGMMAAISAAGNGADVTLIERNEKLGKKIYITGKGRCNFSFGECAKACGNRQSAKNLDDNICI